MLALVGQHGPARFFGLSLPTIERTEGPKGKIGALIDRLERVLLVLTTAGIDMIADVGPSAGLGSAVSLISALERRRSTNVA